MNWRSLRSWSTDSDPIRLRASVPVWCSGCQTYVSDAVPHDADCTFEIEKLAHRGRARARGDLSFKGYLFLYGIFICLVAVGYVVWQWV